MKNRLLAAIGCLLTVVCIFFGAVPVYADNNTVGKAADLIDDIISYKKNVADAESLQAWLDGELARGAGTVSEWYVIALRQYNKELNFTAYADALENFLANNKVASATSRQRCSLALVACGRKNNAFVTSTADDSIGEQGVTSRIFGLNLLNNGVPSNKYTVPDLVEELLSLRLADGGWALNGERSDVDITAMAIQALSPHYTVDSNVKNAVDKAIELLGANQLDNGGYKSYGAENPEVCAQVLVALSSVGIDAENDLRFIKNGKTLLDAMLTFRLSDGSFSHTVGGAANNTATVQALYSFVSLWRVRSGLSPLYVFNADNSPTAESKDETEPPESSAAESSEAGLSSESDEPSTTSSVQTNRQSDGKISYKVWACLGVVAVMFLACLILFICKKRHYKNFILVFIIGAVSVCIILLTDFSTADDYYRPNESAKADVIGTVTLTIRCDTIVGKSDLKYIPSDGIILPVTNFEIDADDTVFDILTEAAKKYQIQIESEGTVNGIGDMVYITGINYLYESDFGELSGWVYHVNGTAQSVGCGGYTLSDGDVIEWLYTCELGNDVKQ